MDLVRCILIQVEDANQAIEYEGLGFGQHSLEEIAYHVEMMQARGLLEAKTTYAIGKEGRFVYGGKVDRLTWDGCDYLDAIRSDCVWKKSFWSSDILTGNQTMVV